MKNVICSLTLALVLSCANETSIKGIYIAQNNSALFESVEFDGEVVTFGGQVGKLMPAYSYQVKNNIIYIETNEGILKFEITNTNTIKGVVSIIKDDVYIKQK